MKPLKQRVSLTLDEDIIERAKLRAEECDRSLSQLVNMILKEYLNNLPKDGADAISNF